MGAPVLMLHGMCCTGAVWDNYRSLFEGRGYEVVTPTLAAHLRRRHDPPPALHRLGFADLVEEAAAEASAIHGRTGQRPVVIGHSMGGLVAQALTERGLSRATLLMSSAPPADCHVGTLMLKGWRTYTIAQRARLLPRGLYPYPFFVRRMVFNAVASEARRVHQHAMVQESTRVFADMRSHHVHHERIAVPMRVVACGRDRMVPAGLSRLIARKYRPVGATLAEYPDHGHWMYAEPGWERAGHELCDWVDHSL